MHRSLRTTLIFVLGLLAPTAAYAQEDRAASPEGVVDSLALARQYTQWLYAGEADSLVARSTDGARESFATREGFTRYTRMIAGRAGFETDVIEETWRLRNGACQYWRTAGFTDIGEPMLVRWVLDEEGRIAALGLGPATQAPPVDAETCGPPE